MCGRFTLAVDPADLRDAFPSFAFPEHYAPRYNIAPTQPVLALPNDGRNTSGFYLWGLIPSWAKDPAIGGRLINARGETVSNTPSFRAAFKYRRCLIPADGFYEWKAEPGKKHKTPYFIHMQDQKPFALAGLWEIWNSPNGGQLHSCTIITTEPNKLMIPVHNRMPVILHQNDYAQWLDPAPGNISALVSLLRPFPAEQMAAHPVSTLVNSAVNDRAECTQPL